MVGVADIVSPEKASVPELDIVHPVVAIVMVPPLGERFPLAPTDNAPLIVKLDEVIVVPVTVKL